MAVTKTPDGRYQVRWRDETNRQRSKIFDRKKDADAHHAQVTRHRQDGTLTTINTQLTVAALADRWLDAALHLSPRSLETYRRDLNYYILPNFGDVTVAHLTAEAIQKWLRRELDRLSPSSVHRHYRTMNTMLTWAVRNQYATVNPCARVNPPRVPRRQMRIFTIEQIEAIAAAVNPRYRSFILVAAWGGLRWSELVGLRRCDVAGAQITVAGQLQLLDGEWRRSQPKTMAGSRTLLLPASVGAELSAHIEEFCGDAAESLVFTNRLGNPLGIGFRSNVWYPACASIGLGERVLRNHKPAYSGVPRFHDLRHTSVALAIKAGAHPKVIQQRLGHSSIAVTMDTYGHLFEGMDAGLADDLDRIRGV